MGLTRPGYLKTCIEPLVIDPSGDTDDCMCPEGFKKNGDDCIPLRELPLRPAHYLDGTIPGPDGSNGGGDHTMESVPVGEDNIKRPTSLQLFSVSPLDRLLNQQNKKDEIRVSVSCYPRKDRTIHPHKNWPISDVKSYDLTFDHDQINTETCHNNARPSEGKECNYSNQA